MGKMHRPPLALAASRDTPSQLGPQGFERESLGEHVVGAAVDGADIVVVAQVNRKRRRNDFLTARRIIWRHQPARLHLLDYQLVILHNEIGFPLYIHQRSRLSIGQASGRERVLSYV